MEAAIDIATRLSGVTTDVATRVTGAIRDAARATGAGFGYLLNTALRESNLNPDAKAKSSSATGLFQFIDQTWLGTMKESGAGLGYGKYADAITRTAQGRFTVADPAMRQQIMGLRKDPTANALMAGAFANANAKVLTARLGRKPTDGELYIAHFLGASGAARFISAAEASPNAKAANFFPRAAHANAPIFYDRHGAKSLKQVYAGLVSRHNVIGATQIAELDAAGSTTSTPAAKPAYGAKLANAANPAAAAKPTDTVKPESAVAAAQAPIAPLAFFRDFPAPASANASAPPIAAPPISVAPAVVAINAAADSAPVAMAAVDPVAQTAPARRAPAPMFVSLFQGDDRGPVSSAVRELWGTRHAAAAETPAAIDPAAEPAATSGDAKANVPLDLLQFRRPSYRRAT